MDIEAMCTTNLAKYYQTSSNKLVTVRRKKMAG